MGRRPSGAPATRPQIPRRVSGRGPRAMGPGGADELRAAEAVPLPFVRVAPKLFLGSARAAGATEQLTHEGVTLCVNVSRQQPGPRAPGVAELRVPVFDDPAEDLLAHLEPTCAAMEAAVRAGGACLVYCKNGRSRSAAVCTAYLMRHRGLSLELAFQKYEQILQAKARMPREPTDPSSGVPRPQ
ncbi:dual specificity phosphatase 28 isoform X2 [Cavia porcellus]|uniref:dual specificity phosphatase 28 isoform X2 n=1 Tax=Cavia porcellus TaxID=10141 RepID=UPI0003513A0A|nr:dual specificity phosphatase 28 isoform X2 [Cavia porcellus]